MICANEPNIWAELTLQRTGVRKGSFRSFCWHYGIKRRNEKEWGRENQKNEWKNEWMNEWKKKWKGELSRP